MGSGDGPPGAHVDGKVVGEVGQGGGLGVLEGVPDDGLGGGDDPMVSGELLDVLLSLFLVLTRLGHGLGSWAMERWVWGGRGWGVGGLATLVTLLQSQSRH